MVVVSGFFPTAVSGALRAAGQVEQWNETKPSPIGFRHWESGQYKPSAKGFVTGEPDGLAGGFDAQKESGRAIEFGQTFVNESGFTSPTVVLTFNLGEINSNPDSFFDIMLSEGSVSPDFIAFNMRFWLDNRTAFTDPGYDPTFYFLQQSGWTRDLTLTSGTAGAQPVPSALPVEQNIFVNGNEIFSSGSYKEQEVSNFIYVAAEFPALPSGSIYELGTYGGLGSGNFRFKLSYEWTGIDANVRVTDTRPCFQPPSGFPPAPSGFFSAASGIQAYWNMDETSGTRFDAVGSLDLTENGTVGSNATGGPDGTRCLETDGDAADYLSHADDAILSVGDRDFTFAGWFYLDDISVTNRIMAKYTTTGNQREYLFDYLPPADSELRFLSTRNGSSSFFNPDTNGLRESSSVVGSGTWHFVAIWHEASANMLHMQVDNGTIDSVATNGGLGIHDGTTEFRFASFIDDAGANDMAGRLARWGIWHRLLTVAERTFLYNGGNGRAYPDDFTF